jgi:hypothetical protein
MKVAVLFALMVVMTVTPHVFGRSKEIILLNADFDQADMTGWRLSGDVCVTTAFCGGRPTGRYWVALSTNASDKDSITMCGASSVGGLQTILRSPDLPLPFKPVRIRIEFNVKFLTNENTSTDLGTDTLTVRLLTMAGPVHIASIDDSGASPGSKNLVIQGDSSFQESACHSQWRHETGMLHVSYYRTFREPVRTKMAAGPMAIEFELTNHFDSDFDSAAVLDDVQIRVYE